MLAVLGLFAITEIIHLMASRRPTISGRTDISELSGSAWEGVRAVFSNFGLFVRSSLLGTVVGIIPGIGATVASFVAYGHAVQSAGADRARFGRGDLRGIIAPEAANDAKDGGALVPTLAFGVPGGSGTAILLTVLTLHGLTPGQEMLTTHLTFAFVLIWSLFLSNWITSLLGMSLVSPLARITTIRMPLIVPVVLMAATVGAYLHRGRIEDVLLAYLFALLGYAMKRLNWPRAPLVIAIVLGPLFENNFHLTLKLQQLGRIAFFSRPIVLLLIGLSIASLVLPAVHRTAVRLRAGARP